MMVEGWSSFKLGDLLEFKNGFNTEKANYGHGTPFINVSEVLKHASLTADKIPGQVNVTEKEANANSVIRGDILFNRTSETTDEVGFTSVYLDDLPVIFGGFVIRGRPVNGALHPEFAQYAMRQPLVRSEIIRRSQGAVRSNIGQGELSKVEISLPPLPEQKKIAEILSTWDQAIDMTACLLENATAQKRALMQQLLTGKRRFPEFEGEPWQEVRLGEVIQSMDAGTSVNSTNVPAEHGALGVLKTSAVSDGVFHPERNKTVVEAYEVARLKEHVTGATIIMSRMNTPALVGANGFVPNDSPNLFLPDRLWAIKPNTDLVDPRWLGHLLASDPVRFRLSNLATGTSGSMKNIAKSDVRSIVTNLPGLSEQRAIEHVLGTADTVIQRYVVKKSMLRREKKGLMQQLLTGKRRVKIDA